jgi:predicted cobalt transporter CbtA
LVSSDTAGAAELTQSLTQGLTHALSGMSVAFSTSLVGILAAIVMTLVGVLVNVPEHRQRLLVELEAYVEECARALRPLPAAATGAAVTAAGGTPDLTNLSTQLDGFAQSVAQLQQTVAQFHGSLEVFSASTRDFREFNTHLRDNIQRMSLGFADLSDSLKERVDALNTRTRG